MPEHFLTHAPPGQIPQTALAAIEHENQAIQNLLRQTQPMVQGAGGGMLANPLLVGLMGAMLGRSMAGRPGMMAMGALGALGAQQRGTNQRQAALQAQQLMMEQMREGFGRGRDLTTQFAMPGQLEDFLRMGAGISTDPRFGTEQGQGMRMRTQANQQPIPNVSPMPQTQPSFTPQIQAPTQPQTGDGRTGIGPLTGTPDTMNGLANVAGGTAPIMDRTGQRDMPGGIAAQPVTDLPPRTLRGMVEGAAPAPQDIAQQVIPQGMFGPLIDKDFAKTLATQGRQLFSGLASDRQRMEQFRATLPEELASKQASTQLNQFKMVTEEVNARLKEAQILKEMTRADANRSIAQLNRVKASLQGTPGGASIGKEINNLKSLMGMFDPQIKALEREEKQILSWFKENGFLDKGQILLPAEGTSGFFGLGGQPSDPLAGEWEGMMSRLQSIRDDMVQLESQKGQISQNFLQQVAPFIPPTAAPQQTPDPSQPRTQKQKTPQPSSGEFESEAGRRAAQQILGF